MKDGAEDEKGDDGEFEAFMARPSTLPDVVITLIGFASEEDANKLADIVRGYLSIFGRLLDLSGLAQVYISFDYAGTLASLERGFDTEHVLRPTADEIAIGVAMTPSVLREGKHKSVIVLSAPHFAVLSADDSSVGDIEVLEKCRIQMIHTLAHECGHVHDREIQVRSFPNTLLKRTWTSGQNALLGTAVACWEEHIASRLSANWGNEETRSGFEDAFCSRLENAWSTMLKSIRLYRMHGDVTRVVEEVASQVRVVLIYGSYLLGHLAGLDRTLEEGAPKAAAMLGANVPFRSCIERLQTECDVLYSTYGQWAGMEVFDPLAEAVHDLFKEAGLVFSERDGQTHIDIPLRADTLPSMHEQLEFMQQNALRSSSESDH